MIASSLAMDNNPAAGQLCEPLFGLSPTTAFVATSQHSHHLICAVLDVLVLLCILSYKMSDDIADNSFTSYQEDSLFDISGLAPALRDALLQDAEALDLSGLISDISEDRYFFFFGDANCHKFTPSD